MAPKKEIESTDIVKLYDLIGEAVENVVEAINRIANEQRRIADLLEKAKRVKVVE